MDERRKKLFRSVRRIVVKAGSNCLTTGSVIDDVKIGKLADDIAAGRREGRQVVLVSSGAIASGSGRLGWTRRTKSMAEKQAAAAVGQVVLMEHYVKHFGRHGLTAAQVLLTADDFTDRGRFVNARRTFEVLLKNGIVPVVNDNDSVATAEISSESVFGDNDMLSALIMNCVSADLLVVLTSVEGLLDPSRRLVPEVSDVDDVMRFVEKSKTGVGTGGMATKLSAMRTVTLSGKPGVIAGSSEKDVLRRLLAGDEIGTVFFPAGTASSRKQWLRFGTETKGSVTIDEGAAKALRAGKSLLASGVLEVAGKFDGKSAVKILDVSGRVVARGIVSCSSEDLEKIKGLRSSEFEKALGRRTGKEAVHRDNLVIV